MQHLGSMVSVIIPIYNCGEVLHRTMQSVISQTYRHLEVLLVDDGSADNSYSIAKAYENEWIKVLRQPNAGAAIARNTGLAASRGEYIQFLDAGDAISPEKIRAQVMILQANPGKLAVCNYRQFTRDGKMRIIVSLSNQHSFIHQTIPGIFSSGYGVDMDR
jgi:glycosyltransferase involved in cell wall biosynthesis